MLILYMLTYIRRSSVRATPTNFVDVGKHFKPSFLDALEVMTFIVAPMYLYFAY